MEITKLLNHEVKEPLNPSPRTTQLEILVWKLGGSDGKASAYNAGDLGSIPGLGRFPGERNGNPLQYPWLENPIDGGVWQAIVHGVTNSWTRLSDFTFSLLNIPTTTVLRR